MRFFTLGLIRGYQLLFSPLFRLLGAQCRFAPSCSEYAREAFVRYGWGEAFRMTLARLLRCHPWNEGGIDYP